MVHTAVYAPVDTSRDLMYMLLSTCSGGVSTAHGYATTTEEVVGLPVGADDGEPVGLLLGATVSAMDGASLGAPLGAAVGASLGANVW